MIRQFCLLKSSAGAVSTNLWKRRDSIKSIWRGRILLQPPPDQSAIFWKKSIEVRLFRRKPPRKWDSFFLHKKSTTEFLNICPRMLRSAIKQESLILSDTTLALSLAKKVTTSLSFYPTPIHQKMHRRRSRNCPNKSSMHSKIKIRKIWSKELEKSRLIQKNLLSSVLIRK